MNGHVGGRVPSGSPPPSGGGGISPRSGMPSLRQQPGPNTIPAESTSAFEPQVESRPPNIIACAGLREQADGVCHVAGSHQQASSTLEGPFVSTSSPFAPRPQTAPRRAEGGGGGGPVMK